MQIPGESLFHMLKKKFCKGTATPRHAVRVLERNVAGNYSVLLMCHALICIYFVHTFAYKKPILVLVAHCLDENTGL